MENGNIKTKNKDLLKVFAKYVSLNILGMMGMSCYVLADTFFIARGVGPDGMTALNIAIPGYCIISGMSMMFGIGGATRYVLTKREGVFTQTAYISAVVSVLFMLLGIICPDGIASLLGAGNDVLELTAMYIRVIFCFAPMFIFNNVIMSFVRNDGAPRLAMAAMTVGSLSNVLLDWVLVFPCGLGMFGAALATGVSPIISLCILSSHFVKHKSSFRIMRIKPDLKEWFAFSSLGTAPLITELSGGIVILVFNMLILSLEGNTGVAAYSIVANMSIVITSVFSGISQGIQPVISRLYSDGKKKDVLIVRRYGFILSVIAAVLAYAFMAAFPDKIVSVFNRDGDPVLAAIAERGVLLYFTAYFFSGINIVYSSYFGAVGNARDSFIISVLRGIIVIIPVTILLSKLFSMDGIWLSLAATELIVMICTLIIDNRQEKHSNNK